MRFCIWCFTKYDVLEGSKCCDALTVLYDDFVKCVDLPILEKERQHLLRVAADVTQIYDTRWFAREKAAREKAFLIEVGFLKE